MKFYLFMSRAVLYLLTAKRDAAVVNVTDPVVLRIENAFLLWNHKIGFLLIRFVHKIPKQDFIFACCAFFPV
ncbi:MAG: hypothetical protein ACXV8O_18330 [Methylobacter sp.]